LQELLRRTLPDADLPEIDFISSPEFGYRRSVRLQVSKDRPAAIGFYRPQSHEVVDIEQCPLLMDELNRAYGRFRQSRPLEGLSNMRIGGIRAVYGRDDHATVISILDKPASRQHAAAVLGCCLDDGEILNRINPRQPQHVHDTVQGLKFQIHPLGFFQSNVFLAETLVGSICQVAEGSRNGGGAVELYCGNGLFTLPLAGMFRNVVAVEQDRQSVADGVANARANGIGNIQWICDAVDRWITVSAGYRQPDFVLVDPPREGLSKTVSRWVLQTQPRRVAYVSCSPPTLARDLKRWVSEGAYRIRSVVGMDLFPQTYHIETLVLLERVA
jgi:23S rRNA (uracil1939-C5)-methyltransferase